ncbi:periplasmic solute binding protein for ABC transport system [Calothrix sp. NIES-4071]|nr:periplasmic solute binding protein for ABC transport system [Calothrix sp. NIES-4071]BAZ62191.1 periplasmic solute binding protein for ABC transport system [Calothrix sp. NIES-4105]
MWHEGSLCFMKCKKAPIKLYGGSSLKGGVISLLGLLVLLTTAACSQTSNQSTTATTETSSQTSAATPTPTAESGKPKIKVVTTFLPMYWFTRAVALDAAEVEILIPPGTEVHDYQATPENVKAIATANVLVKNGLGLEEFLEDTVKNAQNAKLLSVDASKGIKALNEISPVVTVEGKGHDHDHSAGNPHVWLDPVLAKQQVTNIRDGLIAADPANKATYEANAAAYIKQLDDLHNEFLAQLRKTPNCTFVTFHDAYPYIAQRYNLKQVAVVEVPEDQLAPYDVQKVVNTVKKYNVRALFNEPGTDNKLLASLSKDLNLTLREIDSLEAGDKDPQSYFKAMKSNLESLQLACK